MSREPSSPVHRYREALGRAGALDPPPEPTPAPRKPKRRNFRVVVPPKPGPTREQAFTKWATSTERLTADERALLRELRQTDTDNAVAPGTTAAGAATRITEARIKENRS